MSFLVSTPPSGSLETLRPREAGEGDVAIDVTIIVPIEHPRAEVREIVQALGGQLDRLGRSWECVLIFDGVRGEAFVQAQELAQRQGAKITLVALKSSFGESVCFSAGMERARGRYLITSPSYVQIDPIEVKRMLAALDEGADFVTPWRKPRVDPFLNRVQSTIFNWVIRRIIPGDFHDLNCYFRAMRRDVFEDIAIYGDMYRFLPVIAHRQGLQVVEVPVRHLREWGKTGVYGLGVYVRRFLDILGVMFLTKFTLKPLRFFGSIGALFVAIGGVILTVLAYQRLVMDAGLYGRPLFLIGIVILMLGVQITGFGLIGEIIIYTQARNLREYRIERIYE